MATPRLPTTPERSAQMGRIRGRDTGPEVRLQRALAEVGAEGLTGYALHLASEPRALKPDLTFLDQGLVIFVDGCQWHGCPEHYVRPRSNTPHWAGRLRAAVERDRRQTAALGVAGWRVLRFWEHRVEAALDEVVLACVAALEGAPVEAEQRWCVLAVQPVTATEGSAGPTEGPAGVAPGQAPSDLEACVLVSLLDPRQEVVVVRARSTRKWRRPRLLSSRTPSRGVVDPQTAGPVGT